jgi:microcystin-dependent protein
MDPFLAEIVIFAGNFAPRGWAYCDGQLLAISQNSALFSLLGTTYGGDGRTSFGLPDLRGRSAVGPRHGPGLSSYQLGQRGGVETVVLTQNQMPSHSHNAIAGTSGGYIPFSTDPAENEIPQTGDVLAAANFPGTLGATNVKAFGPASSLVAGQAATSSAPTILNNGGSQYHTNIQPFLSVNYIIALQGVFPSRN